MNSEKKSTNGGQTTQVRSIKYRNIYGRMIECSPRRALIIARALYGMSNDPYRMELINRRFYGIEFTEEQLKGEKK